jgi:hypothetical protein
MRNHCTGGRLTMRTGNAYIKRTVCDGAQHIASFYHTVIILQKIIQLFMVFWNAMYTPPGLLPNEQYRFK